MKKQLLDIYLKMDGKRIFTDNSVFELNKLVSSAIGIIKGIDTNSSCYQNLLKAQNMSDEYHKIPFSKITQNVTNKYAMDIIRLAQYSIKELSDKY